MIPTLSQRATRTRLITVGADLAVTLDETATAYFPAKLVQFAGHSERPRDAKPSRLYWLREIELGVGSRVSVAGASWELVGPPEPQRTNASTTRRLAADVIAVQALYPRVAALQELGGSLVSAAIPCALWQPRERDSDRGSYADYVGEAPIEFASLLDEPNRQLDFGAETLKIARAVTDYETPRVSLELTRGR